MEEVIIGKWIFKNEEVIADSNCLLIESMVKNDLKEIKSREDGLTKQYEGKEGAIWELAYPESHLQGGGVILPKFWTLRKVCCKPT